MGGAACVLIMSLTTNGRLSDTLTRPMMWLSIRSLHQTWYQFVAIKQKKFHERTIYIICRCTVTCAFRAVKGDDNGAVLWQSIHLKLFAVRLIVGRHSLTNNDCNAMWFSIGCSAINRIDRTGNCVTKQSGRLDHNACQMSTCLPACTQRQYKIVVYLLLHCFELNQLIYMQMK